MFKGDSDQVHLLSIASKLPPDLLSLVQAFAVAVDTTCEICKIPCSQKLGWFEGARRLCLKCSPSLQDIAEKRRCKQKQRNIVNA